MKSEKRGRGAVMGKLAILLLLAMAVAVGCKDGDDDGGKDEPKTQTATLTGLFDNNTSVTVTGTFTNAEWDGVPDKIKTALNTLFIAPALQTMLSGWLNKGVTIIIEKDTEYAKYKTVGDGKTIHLNYAIMNDKDELMAALYAAGASIDTNGTHQA